jgi:hypothetical protein
MDEVRLQEEGEPAKEMTARPPAKHAADACRVRGGCFAGLEETGCQELGSSHASACPASVGAKAVLE